MMQAFKWFPDFWRENFGGFQPLEQWGELHNVKDLSVDSIDLSSVWYWIVLFVVILFAAVLLLRCHKVLAQLARHVSWMAILVWVFGVLVYIVGFYDHGVNGLSVVPRAIISSFKMFVVSNDLARIHAILRHDALYMAMFSLTHFAAAFITFLLIFRMIGYKMKSSLDILWYRFSRTNAGDVHLFWGVNEASCLLAEDIKKSYRSDKIIFIDIDEDSDDNAQKKISLNRIVDTMTIKGSEMRRLDDIEALVDHCYNGPAAVTDSKKSIFAALHLRNIGAILRKSKKVNFYFLSDDEDKNITGALNLQRDRIVNSLGSKSVTIYVHARRDANNEIFDHYSQYVGNESQIAIKLVDSAYLSVVTLKENDRALPVNCIKENERKMAVVEKPFNAMIVGFGATGQEAFKFLYEFAAFAGPDRRRSPFKCYAIDSRMDEIEGLIRRKMPNIKEDRLSLIKAKVDSEEFWSNVEENINELNYIVIALNDDTLGLSLAVNLFKIALQRRSVEHPMLKIMLRCYDHSQEERMEEVAQRLNNSIDGKNIEILLFGREKELYKCENVLADLTLKKAKEFNRVYANSEKSADDLWKDNFGNKAIDEKMARENISRYHAIYDINRCVAQNISNAQHCRTKMILLGFDEKEPTERMRLYSGYVKSRGKETTTYDCGADDAQLLLNVAIVEHERWIASHELMGYTYNATRDYVKKHHECLLPWDELDEATRSFDCKVVDTTVKLEYQEAKERREKK